MAPLGEGMREKDGSPTRRKRKRDPRAFATQPEHYCARRTHCAQGHAYTPENTYWRKSRYGRMCRRCKHDRTKRAEKAKALAARGGVPWVPPSARSPDERRQRKAAYNRRYRQANREQVRAREKAWRQANPDALAAKARRLRARHPEWSQVGSAARRARERAAEGRLTATEWRGLVAAFKGRCAYCRRRPKRLTQDHVIPLARGGRNDVTNVVPACARCNFKKHAGPPPVPVQPMLLV